MRVPSTLALLACLGGLCGCSSMARLNVIVQIDEKHIETIGTVPTVEVNLVGVNEAEYPQWAGYSIDQYWKADDNLRKGADRFILEFGQTESTRKTLSEDGKAWDTWEEKTSQYLFVIADIPGMHDPPEGKGKDGRVLELPLAPERWSTDTITITVKPGGITVTPSPEMPKE